MLLIKQSNLSTGPSFMDVSLVLELLGKMFQTFEPHQLSQQPLFEGLFASKESIPGTLNVSDHLTLGWHIGWPSNKTVYNLICHNVRK